MLRRTLLNKPLLCRGTQIRHAHITRMSRILTSIQSKQDIDRMDELKGATIDSHRLLLVNGYIRQLSQGLYTMMPLAERVIEKLSRVIDHELNKIDAQKVTMPKVQPKELWEKTGRWESNQDQLFIAKDHKNRDYCLAPTAEECVTQVAANELLKQGKKIFPLRIYQTGTKYRDELRPKFGLMRAKEFLMKDMYSFDMTAQDAFATYDLVVQSYKNIFEACDLDYVIVDADSGSIGGSRSNEFQILAKVGDDNILYCGCPPQTRYAANIEKAVGVPPQSTGNTRPHSDKPRQVKVNHVQYEKIKNNFKVHHTSTEHCSVQVLLPHDRNLNEIKFKDYLKNIPPQNECLYLVDSTVIDYFDECDQGVVVHVGDFRDAKEGDLCANSENPNCKCLPLKSHNGIEIGHVFYLGQKYSRSFDMKVDDSYVEMGCYGIGVSRVMQCIVETHNDDKGIVWPILVAPYRLNIIPMRPRKEANMSDHDVELVQNKHYEEGVDLYKKLSNLTFFKNQLILDDRLQERPFSKINTSTSLGIPITVVIGKDFMNNQLLEVIVRKKGEEDVRKMSKEELLDMCSNLSKSFNDYE
ncbi:proline tRS [Acrasis kona]|uniref:proline--tRNA ligase n=1 Tax=Acrasis kona TaxID=1008807 RepID=A0AAW2YN91_9EUKA